MLHSSCVNSYEASTTLAFAIFSPYYGCCLLVAKINLNIPDIILCFRNLNLFKQINPLRGCSQFILKQFPLPL